MVIKTSVMKTSWFRQVGIFYIPIHAFGYLVTLIAIAFVVNVAMAILRTGHSISDDLFHLFVYLTCTAFWWKWVADKTSEK
jgi:hypothetical protein